MIQRSVIVVIVIVLGLGRLDLVVGWPGRLAMVDCLRTVAVWLRTTVLGLLGMVGFCCAVSVLLQVIVLDSLHRVSRTDRPQVSGL